MKRIAILTALFFASPALLAAELTLQWQIPTQLCDGTALPAADLTNIEIYIDETPVPGPAPGTECDDPIQDPPAGFTPTVAPATDGTVTIQVAGGKTYFARARVQHVTGTWSSLSLQASADVPIGNISPPTLLIIPL